MAPISVSGPSWFVMPRGLATKRQPATLSPPSNTWAIRSSPMWTRYAICWQKRLQVLSAKSSFARCCAAGFIELLPHPLLQSDHVLWPAEEVLDQVVRRHGTARLEYQVPVADGRVACQQVIVVELHEKVLGDHFVPKIGVIGGRVAAQMAK